MPRKSIIFLDKTYKSQGEFEVFVRNLIYNEIGLCDDIKNKRPAHYNTLNEVLKRHPNYHAKTENMRNLKTYKDALNSNALKIMIVNTDDSENDISWRIAISGKAKENKSDLICAMRTSVLDQIKLFKKNNKKKCVLCFATDNLHVDHILHFDELVFNFINLMNTKNIITPKVFDDMNDNTHRKCFFDTDNKFKNEWIDYHLKNATLRILCQTCNLTRCKSKQKITKI